MGEAVVDFMVRFVEGLDEAPANNVERGLEIAERQRSEERLRDGMRQNVGVRVAGEADGGRHGDAPQHQRPPLDEGVQVPAEPDSIQIAPCRARGVDRPAS
jgi:hypothetical protein